MESSGNHQANSSSNIQNNTHNNSSSSGDYHMNPFPASNAPRANTLYLAQDSSLNTDDSTNLNKHIGYSGVTSSTYTKIPSIDTIPGQQYSVPPFQVQVPEGYYHFPRPSLDPPRGLPLHENPYSMMPSTKMSPFKNSDLLSSSVPRPLPSFKQDPNIRMNPAPTLGQLAVKFQNYSSADGKFPEEAGDDGEDEEEGGGTGEGGTVPHGAEHTGRWTKREHELFLEALKKHGKEWKKVAAMVKTRTVVQTRTHAQKYFQKVQKYIFPEHHGSNLEIGGGGNMGGGISMGDSSHSSELLQRVATPQTPNPPYLNHALLHQNKKMKIDPETILSVAQPLLPSTASPAPAPPSASKVSSSSSTHETDADYFYCDPQSKPQEASTQSPLNLTSRYQRTDLPPPSPASCGKRKKEEVAVAHFLSGSASPIDLQSGVQALTKMKTATVLRNKPPPRSTRPGNGIGLSIINPDTLPSFRSEDEPNTPWDCDMRELETKQKSSALHVAAQTTIEQNEFIRQVCESSLNGDIELLLRILATAQFSDSEISGVSLIGQDIGRAKTPTSENGEPSTYHSPSSMAPPEPPDPRKTLLAELLNRVNDKDESVLMIVCSRKLTASNPPMLQSRLFEVIKVLVEHGANVTLVNNKLQTCLHLVAFEGYDMLANYLIMKGCSVNAADRNGDTAAHIATRQGHLSVIQVLTNCGANFHLRNNSWRCPLDLARDCPELHLSRLDIRRSILTMEPRLRSLVLYHEDCLEHAARRESDWEGPDRLTGIMELIKDTKAFPSYQVEITNQFPKAPVEMLSRVHSSEYIAFVNTLSKQVQETGNSSESSQVVPFTPHVQRSVMKQMDTEIKHPDGCDTSFSSGTLKAARRAAGAVAHAVDRVLLNRNRNAFCVVRPPGHHAGYNGLLDGAKSCGFCIFNSVAAGALHALEAHNCERVAIIDIDVHHGKPSLLLSMLV
jgi:SHAQKYF class myb-like DNA-binding protein